MSGIRYKRTENHDDETPLPVHSEEDDAIEMEDMGGGNTNNTENPEEPASHPVRVVYKRRRTEACYLVWAVVSTVLFLILITIAILAHQPKRRLKWCCVNDNEVAKCKNMSRAFLVDRFVPQLMCVSGNSIDGCIDMIDRNKADAISISNSYLYKHKDRLLPVMAEDYESSDFVYYYVAVVQRNDNLTNLTASGLSKRKACIRNVELAAGYLSNNSVIQSSENTCNYDEALTKLFGQLCVPQSQTLNKDCVKIKSTDKEYARTQMIENCFFGGDSHVVAFIDHLHLLKYFSGKSSHNSSEYQLLCPDGSRAKLTDFKTCNLLWQPSNSLVVSSKERSVEDADVPIDVVELLHVAQLYYGIRTTSNFNMFESKGSHNLIFQDETQKLVPLRLNCTAESYLGENYMKYRASYECKAWTNTLGSCMLPHYT